MAADAKQQAIIAAFATWGAKKFGKGLMSAEQFLQQFQQLDQKQQQQLLQAFQQDPEGQQMMKQASSGAMAARLGAKLQYIKRLKGVEEFKCGGKAKKESDPVADFKKKRKACKGQKMEDGGKKTAPKKMDQASKDSIAVNKYNDLDIQVNRPGKYKKGVWVPDRTQAPYKKK